LPLTPGSRLGPYAIRGPLGGLTPDRPRALDKPLFRIASFLWVAFAAAPHVAGQIPTTIAGPGSIEVGVGGGRFFGGNFAKGATNLWDRKVGADQDILQGVWVSTQLTSNWGLEVALRRTKTHIVDLGARVAPNEPALASFIPTTVEALGLRSFDLGNFRPFVGFGLGFMNVEIDNGDPNVRDVDRFCISGTFGARYYATKWIGVRIDGRIRATYLGPRRLGEDQGWTDTGRWFRNAELLGGIFLSFGGRQTKS
jgi:outer membrane protein W